MDDLILRVDKDYNHLENFLKEKGFSRGLVSSAFREGRIFVNSAVGTKSMYLKNRDTIRLVFKEEEITLSPSPFNQEILYEDQDLLVVNKSQNLAIMPCRSHPEHTFANQIAGYFKGKSLHRKIRLLGRLDKDTTGVMVVCKNPYSLYKMEKDHTKNKVYHGLVCGRIWAPLRIDLPIGMGEDTMVRRVIEGGQRAISTIWPIATYGNYSLVKIHLETGRTHQIRCHLSHIGHPLLGDELYGGKRPGFKEPLLHVYKLSIVHPRTGKSMEFVAPYPKGNWSMVK